MKSELQNAADRVRETQQAIEVREAEQDLCVRECKQALDNLARAELAEREAQRRLQEVRDILYAQRNKLSRELNEVATLVAGPSDTVNCTMPTHLGRF